MKLNKRKLFLALGNLIPAFLVMILAQANFYRFLQSGQTLRVSHLLLIVQLVVIAFFFLSRYEPKVTSWKLWDVFISFIGTFAPFMFSLKNQESVHASGIAIQILGNVLSLYAILSLNRAIGILPANRGIQTEGMYRFVRHPLYVSYQIANIGYIMNHASYYNIAVALIGFLSQILRVFSEERLLAADPDYKRYIEKVRWRLIPYIF